jgi:hypothetical protein
VLELQSESKVQVTPSHLDPYEPLSHILQDYPTQVPVVQSESDAQVKLSQNYPDTKLSHVVQSP